MPGRFVKKAPLNYNFPLEVDLVKYSVRYTVTIPKTRSLSNEQELIGHIAAISV